MYDRYSLGRLLAAAGFSEIEVMSPHGSRIPGFKRYHLDVLEDGSVRQTRFFIYGSQESVNAKKKSAGVHWTGFDTGRAVRRLVLYWQCLLDETVPLRRPIPTAELNRAHSPSPNLASEKIGLAERVLGEQKRPPQFWGCWRVPEAMRANAGSAPARAFGKLANSFPCAWKEQATVASEGQGRFCVKSDLLWLSSSDGSDPLANGRTYEFELERPDRRAAVMAAGLLVLAVAMAIGLLPISAALRRLWDWLQVSRIAGIAAWPWHFCPGCCALRNFPPCSNPAFPPSRNRRTVNSAITWHDGFVAILFA